MEVYIALSNKLFKQLRILPENYCYSRILCQKNQRKPTSTKLNVKLKKQTQTRPKQNQKESD